MNIEIYSEQINYYIPHGFLISFMNIEFHISLYDN